MTIIMVTHQAPGDTFWDRIRKGAEAAAAKDGIDLQYSSDPDATTGQPDPDGHRHQAGRHRGHRPNTGAIGDAIKKAIAAGIPVTVLNAGVD